VCDAGRFIEGSFRDIQGRDFLQFFAPLIQAGGHPSAFGFVLPYAEWGRFNAVVQRIAARVGMAVRKQNPVVDMPYGMDIQQAECIAFDNEFATPDSPPQQIRFFYKRVVESTKYGGFSYLIWSNGERSIWARSEKQIVHPRNIILQPYLQKDLKFQIVWR
jgi:hypothetical protein